MKKVSQIAVALALPLTALGWLCIWDHEFKYLFLWAAHLLPTALVSVPLWYFNRRRVNWGACDFLIVIVPYLINLAADFALDAQKGFGNLVADPLVIGCMLPFSPAVRVIVGTKSSETQLSAALLVLLCFLALAVSAFVPVMGC